MPKRVVPRARAAQDVDEAISYYLHEAGDRVALRFIDAVERAYRHISGYPASGSLRYAQELDLLGLRFWRLRRFPYLVFYIEHQDHVDVWRVLQAERDIPKWLADQENAQES